MSIRLDNVSHTLRTLSLNVISTIMCALARARPTAPRRGGAAGGAAAAKGRETKLARRAAIDSAAETDDRYRIDHHLLLHRRLHVDVDRLDRIAVVIIAQQHQYAPASSVRTCVLCCAAQWP